MVKDANGVTVGQYFPNYGGGEIVLMKTAAGQPFALPMDSNGFAANWITPPIGAGSVIEFTSSNCTGTAYLGTAGGGGYRGSAISPTAIVPPGIRFGSTVWVPGSVQPSIVVNSIVSFPTSSSYPLLPGQTAPVCGPETYTDSWPFSVVGTFDLSVLAFPLSVQ
jgi:hypothetical protein